MKKSKLSLGLVTAFVASLALSGCSSSINGKKNSLVTFEGHNGEVLDVVTDEMYKDYLKGVNGIKDFYDKVLEVLIRYEFEHGKKAEPDKSYSTIVEEAKNNVKAQKNTAEENEKSNGTSYSDEWEAILNNYGVENEKELLEHFIYQIEKTQLEDWFLKQEEETLVKQFIGINETGADQGKAVTAEGYPDLVGRLPYHIRHILVKIETDGNNFTNGVITSDQATKLYDIVHLLNSGINTFGDVAKISDDTSKSDYGDVGIMTNKASSTGDLQMFPEFQLGIYVYDALVKNKDKAFAGVDADAGLALSHAKAKGANSLVADEFTSIPGLVEVPFSVFEDLGAVSDVDVDEAGYSLSENDAVLPRNILYNRYLNHRNPFVITNADRTTYEELTKGDFADLDNTVNPNSINKSSRDDASLNIKTSLGEKKCGFIDASLVGLSTTPGTKVLTDENDNVIIGLRSSSGGIHFIVVQRSIFDVNDGVDANVSLAQYYTTEVPGATDYPQHNGQDKNTYVNFINAKNDKSVYEKRATDVKDAIKSFDPTYEYRLYEWLMTQYSSRFTYKFNLDTEIKNYVTSQREDNKVTQEDGMKLAWDEYLELIAVQDEFRTTSETVGSETVYTRVVPEGCMIGFKQKLEELKNSSDPADKALYEAYQKGGMCYHGK